MQQFRQDGKLDKTLHIDHIKLYLRRILVCIYIHQSALCVCVFTCLGHYLTGMCNLLVLVPDFLLYSV